MAFHMEVQLTAIKVGDQRVPLESGKLVIDATYEGCVDGSRYDGVFKGNLRLAWSAQVPEPDNTTIQIMVTAEGAMSTARQEPPKK